MGHGSRARGRFSCVLVAALTVAGVVLAGSPSAGAATGDITTFTDPGGNVSGPRGIAAGPDGNLWFTSGSNNRIGRIDPDDGSITTFTDPGGGVSFPYRIVAGPDGNLWFTSQGNNRIGRIDPDDGSITTFTDPGGNVSSPYGIAAGPDGNLWFTSSGNNRIGRIDPDDGSITTFTDPGIASPTGIAAGPDGNLWFTSSNSARIGRIDPDDGRIVTFLRPDVVGPFGIAAGPDGNLWFTIINNRIGRIDPDDGSITTFTDPGGNVSLPLAIAAGPDGNLWFTNGNNNRLGRIDPDDGSITTFTDPGGNVSKPEGIAAGPDGNIWFTSLTNGRIGRVEVDTTPGAPTGVAAAPTNGGAQVTWAAPVSNGGSAVTSYVVFRDGVEVHETADGATLAFADSGLTNGTEYDYEVAAVNVAGEGAKSSVVSATPEAPVVTPAFVDVGVDHPFFEDIEWMAAEGISEGSLPGPAYRPSAPVSRQAMSAFLYRVAGEPTFAPPPTPSFTDVSSTHPFFAEVEWLADTGISEGFLPGPRYRPSAPVSRQAMSAFLYRVAGEPTFAPPPTPSFTDVSSTHPFFAEIEWLADTGISEGLTPGPQYRPSVAVSRQAMSAFMHRLADGPGVEV
jgi:streptogramin lyase